MYPTAKHGFSSALVLASLIVSQGCDRATAVTGPTPAVADRSDEIGRIPDAVDNAPGAVTWRCFASTRWRPADCPTRLAPLSAVTAAAVAPPSSPVFFSSNVGGSRVTLAWRELALPGQDNAATSYVLEAGSASGLADIAVFDTGTPTLNLYVEDVPAGIYYVRVKARNALGISGPSNEIRVHVGAAGPPCTPATPGGFSSRSETGTLTLTWTPFYTGTCAPTSYIIEVGSAPGLTDLTELNTGTTFSTFTFSTANIDAGAYYVQLRAASGGLKSAPTNQLAFGISLECATPLGQSTLRYPASGGVRYIYLFEFSPCAAPSFSYDVPWLTRGVNPTLHFLALALAIAPNTTGVERVGHVIHTAPRWTAKIAYVQDAQ